MNQADLEREARELLAAEYRLAGYGYFIKDGQGDSWVGEGEKIAIRAIVAALRKPQQEAPGVVANSGVGLVEAGGCAPPIVASGINMTDGLLPCPLCGGQAEWMAGSENSWAAAITCKACGLDLHEQDPGCMDRAAFSWNKREAAAALAGRGEADFLEDWLRFHAEPIGQECCGRGRPVGEFGMECCGNPEPVFNTTQDVIEAMAARHRELTAAPQPQEGGK